MEKNKNTHEDSSYEQDSHDYWIGDFFSNKENQFLARVCDSFLEDSFNLIGLNKKIDNLEKAYNAIMDKGKRYDIIEEASLYYLIHQRYIFTMQGLEEMLEKIMNKDYGVCPKVGCSTQLIPIGLSNEPRVSSTKVYCHNCVCLYSPKGHIKGLDGCAWGKYFPHFIILTYPYKFKRKVLQSYVPRIYGFKLCERQDDYESPDED